MYQLYIDNKNNIIYEYQSEKIMFGQMYLLTNEKIKLNGQIIFKQWCSQLKMISIEKKEKESKKVLLQQ